MAIVVPDVAEGEMLELILNQTLTLGLFSNDVTLANTNTAASFTAVSGGGYATKSLTLANWDVITGSTSTGIYYSHQTWTFTGATDSPGTIYGYYITDAAGVIFYAERFPSANVPFTPKNGSIIKIKPVITLASVNTD